MPTISIRPPCDNVLGSYSHDIDCLGWTDGDIMRYVSSELPLLYRQTWPHTTRGLLRTTMVCCSNYDTGFYALLVVGRSREKPSPDVLGRMTEKLAEYRIIQGGTPKLSIIHGHDYTVCAS